MKSTFDEKRQQWKCSKRYLWSSCENFRRCSRLRNTDLASSYMNLSKNDFDRTKNLRRTFKSAKDNSNWKENCNSLSFHLLRILSSNILTNSQKRFASWSNLHKNFVFFSSTAIETFSYEKSNSITQNCWRKM